MPRYIAWPKLTIAPKPSTRFSPIAASAKIRMRVNSVTQKGWPSSAATSGTSARPASSSTAKMRAAPEPQPCFTGNRPCGFNASTAAISR